ncbi:zinc finger protein 83-like [Uranotaenia lowii]|uniref:zinc finger protein 83-like n=1 Tax=Uranotaenia lowii TaxID=190385 RepID=UPI002478437A|nr:zinc finger protein 83-like [Uranotaenia lowii]
MSRKSQRRMASSVKVEPEVDIPSDSSTMVILPDDYNAVSIKQEDDWKDNLYNPEATVQALPLKEELPPCEICGLVSVNEHSRRAHLRRHRDQTECEICHKLVFKRNRESHQRQHERIEAKPKERKSRDVSPCNICGLVSINVKAKRHHMRRHNGDTNCEICQRRISSRAKESHKSWHARMDKSKKEAENKFCNICNTSLACHKGLTVHLARVHGIFSESCARMDYPSWPHQCERCGIHLRFKELVEFHDCREKTVNVCSICDENFDHADKLKQHISRKHKVAESRNDFKKWDKQCTICGKKFSDAGGLLKHTRTIHLKEKNFNCDRCDKKFAKRKLLEQHYALRHLQKHQFECEFCQKPFYRRNEYVNHRKQNHPVEYAALVAKYDEYTVPVNQLYALNGCNVVTESPSEPATTPKNVVCKQCGKKYVSKVTLRQHLRLVHMFRRYACSKCDESFKHPVRFGDHYSLAHLRKPRYQCEFCGKKIYWRQLYFRHRRAAHPAEVAELENRNEGTKCNELYPLDVEAIMSKKKRIIPSIGSNPPTAEGRTYCDVCRERFIDHLAYKRHMNEWHWKKTTYTCGICNKVYHAKVVLQDHYAKAHFGRSRYQCEFCGKRFNFQSNYVRHRRADHPTEYAELEAKFEGDRVPINTLFEMNEFELVEKPERELMSN